MPKNSKAALVLSWIRNYPELILEEDHLVCTVCGKTVMCKRKSQVDQHVRTALHEGRLNKSGDFKDQPPYIPNQFNGQESEPIATPRVVEPENFERHLHNALTGAGIPLRVLDNTGFRTFLETYCQRLIPTETEITQNYADHIYRQTVDNVKQYIDQDFIFLIVDEIITDSGSGEHIVNLLIGPLNAFKPAQPYLISSKELQKTSDLTIARFVNESLMNFFLPEVVPTDRILLMVSNASVYMSKAAQNMKIIYANLIHLTCLDYCLNQVAQELRSHYPLVHSLVRSIPKLFVRAPLRVQALRERMPNLQLPPAIIPQRWNTWLDAATFYHNHLAEIKTAVTDLVTTEPNSVILAKCTKILENSDLLQQLSQVHSNYAFLGDIMASLRNEGLSLSQSMAIIHRCRDMLALVQGEVGALVLAEFDQVLAANEGFQILMQAEKVLSGENEHFQEINLSPQLLRALQNAPLTTVDVERCFPNYKMLLMAQPRNDIKPQLSTMTIIKHEQSY